MSEKTEKEQKKKDAKKGELGGKAEKVINLCLRRGILFPTGEIYGSFAGFFDYGPVGVEMERNLEAAWWNHFVHSREDVVGIDGAIITHPTVWKASGHCDAFNDPLVECRKCKSRFRADQLIEDELKISVDGITLKQLDELIKEHKLVCPKCRSELSSSKVFNLMFKTHIGAVEDDSSLAFLRPETAQLIFVDFKTAQFVSRKQLPFGIAQIGKSFRNEIAPRNFVFRSREFSQMELEFFIHPTKVNNCPFLNKHVLETKINVCTAEMQAKGGMGEVVEMSVKELVEKNIVKTKWHAYWIVESLNWFHSLGIHPENLRIREHLKEELSHYSSETWDVEYNYPWGWKELEGIANRGDFDLKQHAKFSGKDLSYFDAEKGERVTPIVIEPSWGLERTLFTLLLDAFEEKVENGKAKLVLRLHPTIAPVRVGVFPLMKKDGLAEKAREVCESLKKEFACEYDEAGSIGKRYARMDEIGTPYCVTIDYDSLEKNTLTLRERDSAKQVVLPVKALKETLQKLFSGSISFSEAGKPVT
ncbi:glycine--tRNA ligase [Candidatus Micrarchaeota archaeon]|nr:glycine--tRNA ligase [Candidatus Micrarchaeota archaeon]